MSTSHSESLISPSSPIENLFKFMKHSFCEREFNEVQKILVDREKDMRIEMENLIRDRDSIKEEVCLLERTQGLVELEKSKLEEKLGISQKKCEDLNEKITRLIEEQRVSRDRAKRAEERYDKVSEENFKMAREKNKIIFELNEKINELKNKNLESERLVGVYGEKFKSLDARVLMMRQEVENLKSKKLAADQMVEELRQKELEADRVVKELMHKNLEGTQTVDELRLQKLKSDKEAELCKSRLESLEPRITKLEAALADILNVKLEDLPSIVDEMDKCTAAEGGNVNFLNFRGDKDNVGNGRTEDEGDNDAEFVVTSHGIRFPHNSSGSESIGFSKKGGGILDQSSGTKRDAAKTIKINPASQSGYNPSPTESKYDDLDNGRKALQNSGLLLEIEPLIVVRGLQGFEQSKSVSFVANENTLRPRVTTGRRVSGTCLDDRVPVKTASSSFAAGNIIEIYDSDDETDPAGAAYVSDRGANVGKNEKVFEEFAQSQFSSQTNKRNRSDCSNDSLRNFNTKWKRSTCRSDKDDSPIGDNDIQLLESTDGKIGSLDARVQQENAEGTFDSQTPVQNFNALNDDNSLDSDDESYSDEHMNNLVASLRSRQKWMYRADMLQAFQDDAQLCMNAICALYRQQLFVEKSTRRSNLSETGGFCHFDSMSGRALAEYLIDGDPELKLRKSVDEVKKERPEVLRQCQRLATTYHEKLYEIYRAGKDPFFG